MIEGACRYLVEDRADITDARWVLAGAEAILHLRALRTSGDFDSYWTVQERRELARHHAARYAGPPSRTIHRSGPLVIASQTYASDHDRLPKEPRPLDFASRGNGSLP